MPADTYQTILQVARRLFVQQGYTATSMRQVAEQAGIGKATIYHHFPDKETILKALLDDTQAKMNQALQAVRVEREPRRRIQVAAEASIHFLYEAADILQVARREVPAWRDEMVRHFAGFFHEYIALLAEAFRKGAEQGIFRPVDPQETARVFMTMVQGTFAMAYLIGERADSPEQAVTSMLDVFLYGISDRPESAPAAGMNAAGTAQDKAAE